MGSQPAAFMSYVRFDDEHEGGQLTRFRELLSAEVGVQTGEDFPIFQDRNDIAWGQHWQTRINDTLDAVTLLIPILTPSFFRSPPCREELNRFLDRERRLGHQDLILPVYYVSASELDDPARRAADELANMLFSRQYADWRELRFEPFTSPVVRRALAQLATRLRDSFWRPTSAPARPRSDGRAPTRTAPSQASAAEPSTAGKGLETPKQEPPTRVVDAYGRGDYTTIGAAIKAARPGDRVLVRPGLYQEGVVVDKPLELLGDGPVADIEVQARGLAALLFKASIGRVANLTLRQVGGDGKWSWFGGKWFAVDITQGRLDLEGCDISSQSLSCVAIRNGADPRLRRNRIHDGKQNGVYVLDSGLGTLEDNDITGNTLNGVEIKTGGNPTLRRNQIHDNKQAGVLVFDSGLGTLEDNDMTGNTIHGVEIRTGGNPTLRRNRINRNDSRGVYIHDGGRGVIEDNDLTANKNGPWNIAKDSEPNVTRAGNRE